MAPEALLTLFLAGDVMLGRGVDQILPHSVDPQLHESYVKSAETYVELAEQEGGRIGQAVDFDYVWGDALAVLEQINPAIRVINLETAVTTSDDFWPGKGIHYRMHPQNAPVLSAAGVDACTLANNHVLDWGYDGLLETIRTLEQAGVGPVGAGRNWSEATEPTIVDAGEEVRAVIFSFATPSSGVPVAWMATEREPGVALLPALNNAAVELVSTLVDQYANDGDTVVFSVHWGGNWGYDIPDEQVEFAHRLIDEAGVDIVHGHSSHHPKGIEVYNNRLILYGAGDLLNDYEGIGGHEQYRPELTLMYFPSVDPQTGELEQLRLVPMKISQIQLNRASEAEAVWLRDSLNRASERFDVRFELTEDGELVARWE